MSAASEVQLTEDQEQQTVEMVATAYGVYSDNPSIPAVLPERPSKTDYVHAPKVMRNVAEVLEKSAGGGRGREGSRQRHGRQRLKERQKGQTEEGDAEKETGKEREKTVAVDDVSDVHFESDSDVQYHNDVQDDSDRGKCAGHHT